MAWFSHDFVDPAEHLGFGFSATSSTPHHDEHEDKIDRESDGAVDLAEEKYPGNRDGKCGHDEDDHFEEEVDWP